MPRRTRLNVEALDARITPVAGALDPSFSEDGIVTQSLTGYYQTGGRDVLVQPDGKVVVAGTAKLLNTMYPAVFRYNADGTLDTTFGQSGFGVLTIPNGTGQLYSVALQPDGKIVASGTGKIQGNYQALVVRLNADGSMDTSFGTGGIVLIDPSTGDDNGFAVAVQPDGKIVTAGNAQPNPTSSTMRTLIIRLAADGALDTTFDGDGVVQLTSGPIARAVLVQSDGMVVVAGEDANSHGAFTLARVNDDGSLDATFGTAGVVKTSPSGMYFNDIRDAVLLPDGRILAVGTTGVGPSYRSTPVLLQYTTTGALDPTFGVNGLVATDLPESGGSGDAVALQDDGKILVGGAIHIPGGSKSIVSRYTAGGQLDATFGASGQTALPGIAMTDLAPNDHDSYRAVAVAPDGRIVAAGVAGAGSVQRLAVARYDFIDLPAVAVADAYAIDRYGVLTVGSPGVLANDARPGGAAIAIVVTRRPDHGTFTLNQAGGFTYTPATNFIGTDSFEYRLDNGIPSDPAIVTLVVRPVIAPPITGVSSPMADGVYGVGVTIPIEVRFAGPVIVTGEPQLALATGTGAVATYTGGSGTGILTFTYTVAAGDNTPDLDYTGPFAFSLNGGRIQEELGNDVPLTLADPGTLGSIGAANGIAIETPIVSLAVSPDPVGENATASIVYTFTRTGATTDPLTVNFFVSGSAVFGEDYTQTGADSFGPTGGTVTIPAGSSTAMVSIDPIADGLLEYDESVVLSLAPAAGYAPSGSRPALRFASLSQVAYAPASATFATGSIFNDDATTTLRLSGGTARYEGSSGTTTYSFTVRLNKAVEGGFTVAYATSDGTAIAGSDYTDNDGTLTFTGTAGETQTISVVVAGDQTAEPDETFSVTLGALSGNTPEELAAITKVGSPQMATILNDDANVTIVASSPSVAEDGTQVIVYTFTRSGATNRALTINFSVGGSATPGTDYSQTGAATFTPTTGTVTFAVGSSTATVTVDPTSDLSPEPNETVVLTVSAGAGYEVASPDSATGTFVDEDVPPDTVITSGPSAGAVASSRSAKFLFTGLTSPTGGKVTFRVSLDGAPAIATTSSKTFANLADGPHTLSVWAVNALGVMDPTPATRTWVVDASKPTVSISGPSAAIATAGDSVSYTITYTDAHLASVTLTSAGITLKRTGTAKGTVQVTGTGNTRTVTITNITGDGTLGISVKAGTAVDVSGLKSLATGPSVSFAVDNGAPLVLISPPKSAAVGGTADFIVTISDVSLQTANLTADHVTLLTSSGLTGSVTVAQIDASHFRVSVSNISGPGTLAIAVAPGVAEDVYGRLSLGPVTSRTVRVR